MIREREVEEGSPEYQAAAFEGMAVNPAYSDVDRLEFAYAAIQLLHKVIDELKDEIAGC